MSYQPGDIILDKYRIEDLIGQGAFGEVYRVTHISLNVPRALKILRRDAPGVGSTEFIDYKKRFQFEAQLGARLNTPATNPNLLQIFNYEEKGDLLLLEMEYASGGSLAERLTALKERGEAMSVEEVVRIGIEVAGGLSALHAMDIVHRDLKPSNILFDEKGHAKVGDLGLAQAHGSDSLRSQLSNPSPHPGTPAYMSPEQHDSRDYLPPASDIYGLGLVLFETLTGRFYRSQRPGTRASSLRKDVPSWLDDLLLRMLDEDPKKRPWNGEEAAKYLQESLQVSISDRQADLARQRRESEEFERQKSQEEAQRKKERQVSPSGGVNWRILGAVIGTAVIVIICVWAGMRLLPNLGGSGRASTPNAGSAPNSNQAPVEPATSAPLPQPTDTLLAPSTNPPQLLPTSAPQVPPTVTPIPPTNTPKAPSKTSQNPFSIGQSVNGVDLKATCLGSGNKTLVIAGSLSGDEQNTNSLVQGLLTKFSQEPLPLNTVLCFLPVLNPDGIQIKSRFNADGVDLNRNWDTSNWSSTASGPYGTRTGKGGSRPFSEPETQAYSNFLQNRFQQSTSGFVEIMYHARYSGGLVEPAYKNQSSDSKSANLAQAFNNRVGYHYTESYPDYTITGELINWCGENGIPCFDILLPDLNSPSGVLIQTHHDAILDVLNSLTP